MSRSRDALYVSVSSRSRTMTSCEHPRPLLRLCALLLLLLLLLLDLLLLMRFVVVLYTQVCSISSSWVASPSRRCYSWKCATPSRTSRRFSYRARLASPSSKVNANVSVLSVFFQQTVVSCNQMVATTSHGGAVWWMPTRWKAGMVCLQGKSCVIHIPERFSSDAFHLRRYTNARPLPFTFFVHLWRSTCDSPPGWLKACS